MENTIKRLMEEMFSNKVVLSFVGPFNQGLLVSIVELIKSSLADEKSPNVIDKIFSTIVELTQNMMEFSLSDDMQFPESISEKREVLLVGKSGQDDDMNFYVCSINVVDDDTYNKVYEHISELNTLDSTEIRKLYKSTIKENAKKMNSGGVGLMTVARAASAPIDCFKVDAIDGFSYLGIIAHF